ncbi:hypothetical protein PAMP_015876 [Pampus punctatissimus]
MEFTRHYLPMEWEERWRREKETRKRAIEEGGEEGIEQDKRELRRIVAYNDSRMGLMSGRGDKEGSEVQVRSSSDSSQEHMSEEALRDERVGHNVCTYHSKTYIQDIFIAMKNFRDSSLLTDLTLTTENGDSFSVHSPILAAVSTFIGGQLREKSRVPSDNDKNGRVYKWSVSLGPEVDHVGLQAVLEFAYTGVISTLNKDTVAQIKAAAQALAVRRVLDLCIPEQRMKKGESPKKEEQKISDLEQKKITLQSIEQLWADRLGCDVILDVDGTLFHVHRVILAASSDYFRGMFTCGMRESYQTCIALPFLLASELDALISCSYSGTLPLSWDCVFEITCMALQLQFQPALSLCLDFMRQEMQASSCLDVASFAEAYRMSELLEEANDFVLRNFWEVSTTAKFHDLQAEKLLDFLCCDGLCAPSELAVFRTIISWVEADPEERLDQAALLMKGVRFPLMTFREFREVRAINLRMECFGNKKLELYGFALKEFGFSLPEAQDQCRVRRPKDALVLVGGDQLNPDDNWKRLADLQECRSNFSVVVHEEHLYAIGGDKEINTNVDSVEMYNADTDSWSFAQPLDQALSGYAVTVIDGGIFISGGFNCKYECLVSMFLYHPEVGTTYLADMTYDRAQHCMETLQGRLYVAGGVCNLQNFYTDQQACELYDPAADSWTAFASLPVAHVGAASAVLEEKIYVLGGYCQDDYSESGLVHRFDPSTQRWENVGKLPEAVTDIRACLMRLPQHLRQ